MVQQLSLFQDSPSLPIDYFPDFLSKMKAIALQSTQNTGVGALIGKKKLMVNGSAEALDLFQWEQSQ